MSDIHSIKIDQVIAQIAAFAHMNGEEAREFIYLYLERQINGKGPEVINDENMEGVFASTAQELKMPITELKTMMYDMLRKENLNGT